MAHILLKTFDMKSALTRKERFLAVVGKTFALPRPEAKPGKSQSLLKLEELALYRRNMTNTCRCTQQILNVRSLTIASDA